MQAYNSLPAFVRGQLPFALLESMLAALREALNGAHGRWELCAAASGRMRPLLAICGIMQAITFFPMHPPHAQSLNLPL